MSAGRATDGPPVKRGVHGRAVDRLGADIVAGRRPPGSVIPPEPELGRMLDVSRTVVRESIKSLVAKGLVATGPKVGTRVRPREDWNWFDADVIAWQTRAGLTDEFLQDLQDLRRVVEPAAARLAASRATARDVEDLEASYAGMAAATLHGGDPVDPDLRFHQGLLRASHNRLLAHMGRALGALLRIGFEVSAARSEAPAAALPLHRAVLDGVIARDPDRAEAAMRALIDDAGRDIDRGGHSESRLLFRFLGYSGSMPIHYVSARLDHIDVFSDEEVAELHRHARAHPLSELTGSPRWKEESAIDFTYTSAQLEGNTYSRADTITLLKTGRTAGGKAFTEAQMIVNLRDTYALVVDRAKTLMVDPMSGIRDIHRSLMRGLLPDDQLGATRRTRNARIGGSEYLPPDGIGHLEKEATRMFSNMARTSDAFSTSLYAACNLSYLQFFEDGNKRTSRVFQNAILMAANLPPVQFPVSMNNAYIEAQLGYYEHGDYLMHRGFMLEAYRSAYPLTAP